MGISYGKPGIARGGKGIKYTENGNVYGMHFFRGSDTFILLEDRFCEYLLVGGGGSGSVGNNGSAGGGGGGVVLGSGTLTAGNYALIIGAGGPQKGGYGGQGNDGSSTIGFSLTALGGGGAGTSGSRGRNGGCGGGNAYYANTASSYCGVALQPSSASGGYGAPIAVRQASTPRGGGAGGEQSGANYYDGLEVWGVTYATGGYSAPSISVIGPAGLPNTGDGGGGAHGLYTPTTSRIATGGGSGIIVVRYQI